MFLRPQGLPNMNILEILGEWLIYALKVEVSERITIGQSLIGNSDMKRSEIRWVS